MTAPEDQRLMRLVATQVVRIFNCGHDTPLGPRPFMAGHDGDHVGLMPVTPLCKLCRGRGDIEDPNSGGDFTCWQCSGTGIQPEPTCPTCRGTGGWQQHDGLIVECPRGCMTDGNER